MSRDGVTGLADTDKEDWRIQIKSGKQENGKTASAYGWNGVSVHCAPALFLFILPAVICGQYFHGLLKCCGKFALALISHSPGNIRDAVIALTEQFRRMCDPELFHI